jgi:replication factor A1
MGDTLLPQLMEGDCSERICVRVARFWELYNPQDESKLLHTDMVLVDEEVRIIL